MTLQLFQFRNCPYCMRIRIVLDEKGVAYERIEVDPKNKPASLLAHSPRGTVPLLVDGALAIPESRVIAEYLDERFPEPPLLPRDPAGRARARLLHELCDRELAPAAYALARQGALRPEGVPPDEAARDKALADVEAALARLTPALEGRDFPCGDFGLVDVAFAPWIVELGWFGVPPERIPEPVRRWAERLADRPSVAKHARR